VWTRGRLGVVDEGQAAPCPTLDGVAPHDNRPNHVRAGKPTWRNFSRLVWCHVGTFMGWGLASSASTQMLEPRRAPPPTTSGFVRGLLQVSFRGTRTNSSGTRRAFLVRSDRRSVGAIRPEPQVARNGAEEHR